MDIVIKVYRRRNCIHPQTTTASLFISTCTDRLRGHRYSSIHAQLPIFPCLHTLVSRQPLVVIYEYMYASSTRLCGTGIRRPRYSRAYTSDSSNAGSYLNLGNYESLQASSTRILLYEIAFLSGVQISYCYSHQIELISL